MTRIRVAVLASGRGSNLQSLIEACAAPDAPAAVAAALSDRPDAGALDRARAAGVPAMVIDDPRDGPAIERRLREAGAALVVLAGYLKLVPREPARAFAGRMLNIHPALLPAFGGRGMYGRRVHEAVLESGVRITGVTVHLVDEVYDRGPIVAQWPVPVLPGDTPDTLAGRVLAVEHQLLPAVVFAAARDLQVGRPVGPLSAGSGAFAAEPRAAVRLAVTHHTKGSSDVKQRSTAGGTL